MSTFDSSGVSINYIDEGAGPVAVLVHGFASSLEGNWRGPGIISALVNAGRRVVAIDCRGHGRSEKPHDPARYGGTQMADDVMALMDDLDIDRADLIGYSMGSFISSSLMITHAARFRCVVLAGVGDALVTRTGPPMSDRAESIARAMEAPTDTGGENEIARGFRIFAERTGNDLKALAAMQRAPRSRASAAKLADTTIPVLVVIGDRDTLVGSGQNLVAAIPGAKLATVPGDHLTAVGSAELKSAMLAFLAEHSPL